MKIFVVNKNGMVQVYVERDDQVLHHNGKVWKESAFPKGVRTQIYPKNLSGKSIYKMKLIKLFLTEWGFDSLTEATQFLIEHLPSSEEVQKEEKSVIGFDKPVQPVIEVVKEMIVEDISPVELSEVKRVEEPEKGIEGSVFRVFKREGSFKDIKHVFNTIHKKQSLIEETVNNLILKGWIVREGKGFRFNHSNYGIQNKEEIVKFNNLPVESNLHVKMQEFTEVLLLEIEKNKSFIDSVDSKVEAIMAQASLLRDSKNQAEEKLVKIKSLISNMNETLGDIL